MYSLRGIVCRSIATLLASAMLWCVLACSGAGTGSGSPASSAGSPSPESATDVGDKVDAGIQAEKYVRSCLKWPDDAEFVDWVPEATQHLSANGKPIWTVTGSVRAKNDFGGVLTHRYECTLQYDSGVYAMVAVLLDGQPAALNQDLIDSEHGELVAAAEQKNARDLAAMEAADRQSAAEEAAKIEAAKYRTWSTADGQFSVNAKFVQYGNGTLTIEKEDGSTVDVQLDVLSQADQDFVKQRQWKD